MAGQDAKVEHRETEIRAAVPAERCDRGLPLSQLSVTGIMESLARQTDNPWQKTNSGLLGSSDR